MRRVALGLVLLAGCAASGAPSPPAAHPTAMSPTTQHSPGEASQPDRPQSARPVWLAAQAHAADRAMAAVAALPPPTTTTTTTTAAPQDPMLARPETSHVGPAQFAQLRECESGGDYTAVNPSGKYRGAYQFDQATWDGTARRAGRPDLVGVDPAAASPTDQDAMALTLYGYRGAQPWPHCGRYLR